MALIKCPECEKEVSDKADSCPNCGYPISYIGKNFNGQSKENKEKVEIKQSISNLNKPKRGYSNLSGLAIVFSILGCTFWIAIILAIIDLRRKDGTNKVFSIIAICISLLWLGIIVNVGDSEKESKRESTEVIQQIENNQIKKEENFVVDDTKNEIKEEPEEDIKEELEEEKQYAAYTVNEMMDDLNNNPLNASDKYKGQYIEITGRLGNIDSSGKYITLYSDNKWSIIGVHCTLEKNNEEQRQAVSSMSMDSKITLRGKCTDVGEVLGYTLTIDSID